MISDRRASIRTRRGKPLASFDVHEVGYTA
jgi:hypothetical protein